MSDFSTKDFAQEIIKAKERDEQMKTSYNSFWTKRLIVYSLITVVLYLIFKVIFEKLGPSGFNIIAILLSPCIVFPMLIFIKGNWSYSLTDGRSKVTFTGLLFKMTCLLESLTPVMFIIYCFNYNTDLGVCEIPIWKVVIYAPIVFVIACAVIAILDIKPYYSEGQGFSVLDRIQLRQVQKTAGLNPDKIPMIFPDEQVKNMSVNDWIAVGLDLKCAGYDIFK